MYPENDLRSIFYQALKRVDPYSMIRDNMRIRGNILVIDHEKGSLQEDLTGYRDILIFGIGKASTKMAKGVCEILGERNFQGYIITRYGQGEELKHIEVIEAGHPIPDENGVRGARMLCDRAVQADEKTLIINLISGGGSALFSLPKQGITLTDLQRATRVLLECGADIQEINCIRKHLSRVQGGQFARLSYPARTINLILSDVAGDRLDTIASGIAVADDTTYAQALSILEKYQIRGIMPSPVVELLESGAKERIPETPKQGDPAFDKVTNIILGNNAGACRAARDYGEILGYHSCFITSTLSGEAREIAKFFTATAEDILRGASDFMRPALIIAGGETTVTVRGTGIGGRNQEMALSFLVELMRNPGAIPEIRFLSAGTDGIDGPTEAAGAIVSPDIIAAVRRFGIDAEEYLVNNDSYHFFQKCGGLFVTGPTNTNVCDIQLLSVR